MTQLLKSGLCRQAQHESAVFRDWPKQMGEAWKLHRKQWEFCFIGQALHERGLLRPGKQGLGFGVGREPLVSLFAKYGTSIVASELQGGWEETGKQHLHMAEICPRARYDELVSFRYVDMNWIPEDLHGRFDFTWSSCSMDHTGSIRLLKRFVYEQMKCLRPGGVAVHTGEYNLSSEWETLEQGHTVVLCRRDVDEIVAYLQVRGHTIEVDYDHEDGPADKVPLLPGSHMKLYIEKFLCTSIGLIITKAGDSHEPDHQHRD